MSWLTFALLTIVFYASFDLFVKLSAERIHAGLGGLIINLGATVVLLIFVVFVLTIEIVQEISRFVA